MGRRLSLGRSAALLALALAGCGGPAAPSVARAWVRMPAVPGRPAAAYFTLRGGSADATLVRVATPIAARAELHESGAGGMRPLSSVPLLAGATVAFAPGARHAMLFDIDPRLRAGQNAPLKLEFADGRQLTAQAELVGPADPPPAD